MDEPAVDGNGNVFVYGYTDSPNLPTLNPGGTTFFQGSLQGDMDILIAKFNTNSVLLWGTYYGGTSYEYLVGGYGKPITIDLQGRVYTTGMTMSSDLPVLNPGGGSFYQGTNMGMQDAIVAQFANNGTMLWSTYYGSNQPDFGTSVVVSSQGCLYATGESVGTGNLFTANPGGGAFFQAANAGGDDGYIAKFCSPTGACCIDNTCAPASTQAECTSMGGIAFYPNQPCSLTTCSILCNICGKKYNDLNKNGVQDLGEPGLSGWTIQLYYWNGPLYASTTTDASGNYCFNNIPCGAWTVNEQMQTNWVQTYPSPNTHSFNMGSGTTINNANFGNTSCVSPDTCCVKAPTGMLAWYPFDEDAAGTAHDIASKTQDGWHYSDQFASTPGKVNGAFLFGESRYIRAYSDPFVQVDSGDFTIDAWINPSSFSDFCETYPYRPCAGIPIVDNRRWLQGLEGDNGIMFYIEGSGTSQARLGLAMNIFPAHPDTFETPTAPIVLNQWQHVAVTVSRVSGTPVGTFYYNGEPVGTFTPQLGRIYSTTSPGPTMDIGHGTFLSNFGAGQTCAAREKYYNGGMDEVEIFGRQLSAAEVQAIYSAGSRGKCKISCSIPSSIVLCKTATTATFNLTVCNQTPNTSVANFSFAALAFGTGCNFSGTGITFSPANGTITLLPGQCTQIPITLSRPAGFIPGSIACFCVTVRDTLTNAMSTCCSKLVASSAWCAVIKNPTGVSTLRAGQALGINFTVVNQADTATNFDYTLMAVGDEHSSDPSALRLNGLPPGIPVTGSIVLLPGEERDIAGSAMLDSFKPMSLESILFAADVDGDGQIEPLDAMLVQPVSIPDCNKNGIDDGQDILFGTSLDANGNGFPDECEGALSDPADCYVCGDANANGTVNISDAVYLIAYIFSGGAAPNPLAAGDASCDQAVNISDAVYLISYIFAGGPQPCTLCP